MHLGRTSSWRPAGYCWTPLSFCAASGGSKGCAQSHEKLGGGVGEHCAAQSARPDAPRSGALAAAAGPKGKGSGDAMQDRPLRCQHGRRWSQSARARWRCISWRSGGRLAVPGPKSDRAAPSWRGWVAQKSAAHHAMVPMQLHKHCHSRDLAERWQLAYCIIPWPLYSQSYRHGNNSCHLGLARPWNWNEKIQRKDSQRAKRVFFATFSFT